MNNPRIFLGSSGKQAKLLQAITRGLEDVADVEPWTTTFNPGRSTLERLVELSQEVDFAAFVFAQDDWTETDASPSGQASPRDNVVFEAGLFGGALGIRRTFILHANGSKLPSDLLGLTSVRYDPPAGRECPGARGRGRDPAGDARSRDRVLDDTVRPRSRAECPDGRGVPQGGRCRSRGAGRRQPGRAGRAHRAAPRGVEIGRERVL